MKKLEKKRDYRHYICAGITVVSLLFGFLFPNSLPRLGEAFRDMFLSFAFYFFQLVIPGNNPIPATVNQMPAWQFAPELWQPVTLLPTSLEEFFTFWGRFLSLLFDWNNFRFYLYEVSDFLFYLSRWLLCLFPFGLMVFSLLASSKDKTCTERGKKSKGLRQFERFLFRFVRPVIEWFKSFIAFVKKNKGYYISWLMLWLLHFNLVSILVSMAGYYFYLISSWNVFSFYTQLLKLQADLTPVIRFLPGIAWTALFWKLYVMSCEAEALKLLKKAEKANRAVLAQNSIISCVAGEPGMGKTQLISSMALSAQVKQFDDAFDIMLNREAQFPNFPWEVFRDYVKHLVDERLICDINQAKQWFSARRPMYDKLTKNLTFKQLRRVVRRLPHYFDYTFGFDYELYASTYNDELKVIHLYDALESYAAAYLIYSVSSSILFSNYSIRSDSQIKTKGNLPLRDNDFFNRDPEKMAEYSQYSHILDVDVIRLGEKFIKNNPKANGAPFGVIVISEIDKEFKNMNLLKETKIKDTECNQKNDLHDAALMMIRHGAVVDFKPFVTVLADLQRPEAWGAGGRELGNVIYIVDKSPMVPALPFYSSYWFTSWIFSWIKRKWTKFYVQYCHNRCDDSLPIYLIRNVISKISNHYERIEGFYGVMILQLEIQSGSLDGDVRQERWHIMAKKDRSNRYRTDCLASVFEKAEPNTMHVDDFVSYAGELATKEECLLQNSFFQRDIHKMKERFGDDNVGV